MKFILVLFTLLALTTGAMAGEPSDETLLATMLDRFLAGASVNDAAAHDRFWAEDLVYTSSGGLRFGKAEIMGGLSESADAAANETETVYSAEDVRIRVYGETAVVAFRLIAALQDGSSEVREYLNSGTFVKRGGEWRVVAWQATVKAETD